ncbi:MAG: hydrogenase formation protein HypD [Candidatus Heimdallarchaeaceae archaeon]
MNEIAAKFRSKERVNALLTKIKELSTYFKEPVRIMHVCGTHEHEVARWGIRPLLPTNIEIISGPGCPVCVCSAKDIDEVLWVAKNHDAIITTFGDMMRVPSSTQSLYQAQGQGVDVRVVYGVADAIQIAKRNPDKEVIFFSVGFETTSCTTALEVLRTKLPNFSIYSSHKIIPPAMELLLQRDDIQFHGFLAPGHVSTIVGAKPYEFCPKEYNFPVAIAGFEPVDILLGIYSVLKQIKNDKPIVDNVYPRFVREEGNTVALKHMDEAYEISPARWRGLGTWPDTGHEIRERFDYIDAKKKYDIPDIPAKDLRGGCICDQILIGKSKPHQCKLFMTACRPEHPIGACMVSHEGTCNVAATYSDFKLDEQ